MMRWTLLLLLAACGGSDPLTCAQLADPNNCWAKAAAFAVSAMPMPTAPGALAADRMSCSWPDGTLVTFDTALPTDNLSLDHLAFTVTSPRGDWKFVDTFMNHMELTANGKTETSTLASGTFTLGCDNGSSYSTDFNNLFKCTAPARAPTDGFMVTATSFQFTISAVNAPSPLFTCM
jgi:hypothetical protein